MGRATPPRSDMGFLLEYLPEKSFATKSARWLFCSSRGPPGPQSHMASTFGSLERPSNPNALMNSKGDHFLQDSGGPKIQQDPTSSKQRCFGSKSIDIWGWVVMGRDLPCERPTGRPPFGRFRTDTGAVMSHDHHGPPK